MRIEFVFILCYRRYNRSGKWLGEFKNLFENLAIGFCLW